MKLISTRLLAPLSIAALGACADTGPSGPGVEIQVAPLTLPGVQGVEYAIAVFNAAPASGAIFAVDGSVIDEDNLVWQKSSVTSGQYGNTAGGDISYVGTCDASNSKNWVAVAIKQIAVGNANGTADGVAPYAGTLNVLDDQNTAVNGDGDADFVNPSPHNDALVLDFDCEENKDTAVVFNFTVMRDAEQGFFDVAVNFDDIFCSAKSESCYDVQVASDPEPVSEVYLGETYWQYEGGGNTYWAAPNLALPGFNYWKLHNDSHQLQDTNSSPVGIDVPPSSLTNFSLSGWVGPATVTLVTTGGAAASGTPIALLHGPNEGDGRKHTSVSAFACTVGADTATSLVTTELLMTTPTVSCNGGSVVFEIDLGGAEEGKDDVRDNGDNYSLYYALYFGEEELDCGEGPKSCNKAYYNIAINIEGLAAQGLTGCTLSYVASAIEQGDDETFDASGALVDTASQYGSISFGGIPLTTVAGAASCNSHPLNGDDSLVQPTYIEGSQYGGTFGGFDFSSTGAGPASAF